MNMNSWHRGAAHTYPDPIDRVMLILTFVPESRSRAETRQLAQGITFSLRWDMWGHTWKDLPQAATVLKQPWAMRRSLGLYKRKGVDWGLDFITSSTMRMANQDYGFKPYDLDVLISDGGLPFLPGFVQNLENAETWPQFLLDTLTRCESVMRNVRLLSVGGYMLLHFVLALVLKSRVSIPSSV